MNVIMLGLEEVKPYEKNPRKNEKAIKYVQASIENFGFKVPIVIDKHKTIVAGHTRYEAAKNLDLAQIPCIVADDLTDEQIKAFRIADNKVSEYSEWDRELLHFELEELQALNFDLETIGFEEWEIEDILNPLTDDDLQDFFVEKEEKKKEPKKIKCPLCNGEFEQ